MMQRVKVIDSHTEGEPTRVVLSGAPDLGEGPMPDRVAIFRDKYDPFRSAIVNEPRGSDVLVGALLVKPVDPTCAAGVIFFNNVGYLGMCGHGAIGLVATLAHLGHIATGAIKLETPAGVVTAHRRANGAISIENVPAYRLAKDVVVYVPGIGEVTGDIAWGGNWFFLVNSPHGLVLTIKNTEALTDHTWRIRQELTEANITGHNGAEIDHIELYGPPNNGGSNRNFVLCPGKAYDRSPCGTGTSAKMACLFADGKLAEGQTWYQEGILGSIFEGTIRKEGDVLIPTITGRAYITSEATLLFDPQDPLHEGIR